MKVKLVYTFLISLFILSCTEELETQVETSSNSNKNTNLVVPERTVEKQELLLNKNNSLWFYGEDLFSGYATSHYSDGSIKEKMGFLDGKAQNLAKHFYPNGQIHFTEIYHKGKLHGEKKAWLNDSIHTLVSHLNYENGKLNGLQRKWYPTGELFKKINMNMGKEEGIQQAYRKNGVLYANYEAREGRIFGMKKAQLCFGIENGEIEKEK